MADNTALTGVGTDTSGDSIMDHDTGTVDAQGRSIKVPVSLIRSLDPNLGTAFDGTPNIVAGGFNQGFTTYSNVTTDLEGFREDFHGTSLKTAISGTSITLTNGATTITGNGTSFIAQFSTCDIYVKVTADPDSAFVKLLYQPYYRGTNTLAYLSSAYAGTGGTAVAGTWTYWLDVIGSGGSITVGSGSAPSSCIAIQAGTTLGSATYIQHGNHYVGPCTIECTGWLDVAVNGTESGFGIIDVPGAANLQSSVVFQGGNISSVTLRTSQLGTDVEANTFPMPAGMTCLQVHRYRLLCATNAVLLFVDDILVGRNKLHLQPLYQPQPLAIWQYNTGTPAVASNFIVDAIGIVAHDQVMVEMSESAAPLPCEVAGYDTTGTLQKGGILGAPCNSQRVALVDMAGNVHTTLDRGGVRGIVVGDPVQDAQLGNIANLLTDILSVLINGPGAQTITR